MYKQTSKFRREQNNLPDILGLLRLAACKMRKYYFLTNNEIGSSVLYLHCTLQYLGIKRDDTGVTALYAMNNIIVLIGDCCLSTKLYRYQQG
jgi:hypothetical protein